MKSEILSTWRERLRHWLAQLRPPKSLGRRGEDAAAQYVRRLGYKIVARGERDRLGELDLVAVDRPTVVFVEVRTRTSQTAGHPVETVDTDKQRRLTRLALGYLKRHGLLEYSARFDIVAITWPAGQRQPVIEHFKNAFECVGPQGMFS